MKSGEGLKNVKRMSVPFAPVFNWSVGNWMEQFFDGLKQKKILASKCAACGRVYLPPRMICERCFDKTEEWVELPETGTVETYTMAHVGVADNGELEDLPEPQIIAMVKHDGADTCMAVRVDAQDCNVGLRVKAVWNAEPDGVLDALSAYRALD
ncbi:MAG: hypothetical protein A2W01_08885 [Candidatus Solincola sediminis]|uniref:Zn-ribbon domain-containing OB-fold protein n=1 Tax=Candidatus Solincola sediminis TaxID=1797199 RepID=A0A1F2WRC2_9ACTN|nr:MAG: hypothetical protein A2Y75_11175 [Candidatus Solincola sediminis]OFW60239.1 MAG: hypothetical protein A2W01_08885 [Candidatus Solincola sediminis]